MKNIVKEKEHIKRLENNNIMIEEVYEKIKNKKRKEKNILDVVIVI